MFKYLRWILIVTVLLLAYMAALAIVFFPCAWIGVVGVLIWLAQEASSQHRTWNSAMGGAFRHPAPARRQWPDCRPHRRANHQAGRNASAIRCPTPGT